MVKVKVLEDFYDREDDLKLKEKNREMEVSEERAKKLVGLGLVEIIKDEDVKEPEGEEKPSKPAKRGSKK